MSRNTFSDAGAWHSGTSLSASRHYFAVISISSKMNPKILPTSPGTCREVLVPKPVDIFFHTVRFREKRRVRVSCLVPLQQTQTCSTAAQRSQSSKVTGYPWFLAAHAHQSNFLSVSVNPRCFQLLKMGSKRDKERVKNRTRASSKSSTAGRHARSGRGGSERRSSERRREEDGASPRSMRRHVRRGGRHDSRQPSSSPSMPRLSAVRGLLVAAEVHQPPKSPAHEEVELPSTVEDHRTVRRNVRTWKGRRGLTMEGSSHRKKKCPDVEREARTDEGSLLSALPQPLWLFKTLSNSGSDSSKSQCSVIATMSICAKCFLMKVRIFGHGIINRVSRRKTTIDNHPSLSAVSLLYGLHRYRRNRKRKRI
uniref:Uncharacterized protein n=1 Tax=Branchiostoma floridae TaxID=7739 RepID=C3YJL9_BRAFL|eukprot:XP_002603315.1 hypothetical protein BRAFLDRAFT_71391 [Branchiostoma floridae]